MFPLVENSQYKETVEALSRLTQPDCTHHAFFAAALAQMGDRTAANAHADEVLKADPKFSIKRYLPTLHYRVDSDRIHLREGLMKAGLPA